MSNLNVARGYSTGSILTEADLDAIQASILSFINDKNITSDNIKANSISGATILEPDSISTRTISDQSISGDRVAASAVTTAKIADNSITTGKIVDGAVSTSKLAGSITSNKFAVNSVTPATRDRSSGGSVLITETSVANIPPAGASTFVSVPDTVNITTKGGPVLCYVGYVPTSVSVGYTASLSSSPNITGQIQIYRDSTLIHSNSHTTSSSGFGTNWPQIIYIDTPPAGTYTYSIRIGIASSDGLSSYTIRIGGTSSSAVHLIACEL